MILTLGLPFTPACSATYSYAMNFTEFLGGVTRNASGHVVGARTALTQIVMQVSRSRLDDDAMNHAGLADEVTLLVTNLRFEFIRAIM